MCKVVPPKLVWKYIGDESPEKRRESEERVRQVYDRIFTAVADNIRRKKSAGFGKIKKNKYEQRFYFHLLGSVVLGNKYCYRQVHFKSWRKCL